MTRAVAVLDGASDATEPAGRDGGWYAGNLADALRQRLAARVAAMSAVGDAINEVRTTHALAPGRSPSSTVALVTWNDDWVDAYVLGDSAVVVQDVDGGVEVVSDRRLAAVGPSMRSEIRARLVAGEGLGREHQKRMRRLVEIERAQRNRPGGYWIAEASPLAATRGVTRRWSRTDIASVIVASDGVTAAVDRYGMYSTWADALAVLRAWGAHEFCARIEAVELSDPSAERWPRSKIGDDKTLIALWVS